MIILFFNFAGKLKLQSKLVPKWENHFSSDFLWSLLFINLFIYEI